MVENTSPQSVPSGASIFTVELREPHPEHPDVPYLECLIVHVASTLELALVWAKESGAEYCRESDGAALCIIEEVVDGEPHQGKWLFYVDEQGRALDEAPKEFLTAMGSDSR